MGIAKYFSKDLLAINQLLKKNNKDIRDILGGVKIGICFDRNAIETKEGSKGLELAVRLLARLYPKISLIDLTQSNIEKQKELTSLARSINSQIEIDYTASAATLLLVMGGTDQKLPSGKKFYCGSENWIAKFSQDKQVTFSDTENPFGCGVSVCILCSNTFRYIFNQFFSDRQLDDDVEFSVLDLDYKKSRNAVLPIVSINELALVGFGAIGNGVMWALSQCPGVSGTIQVIDHETVSLSNLQRYILLSEDDIDKPKVELAPKFFSKSKLNIIPFQKSWADFLASSGNWKVQNVAVAIDNKKDRVSIQSSLPEKIFNAYTEENLIGIAEHADFVNAPCLACGYIPVQKERNYTEEVAANCNIPQHVNFVKDYLNLNISVDSTYNNMTTSLLDVIATANSIERSQLNQFNGKNVQQFYSEFVCGGISMSLSKVDSAIATNVDAPLAFQSAMAGILLASRVVIDASALAAKGSKQQTHFYPLNRFDKYNPFNHNLQKDFTGRCLCADRDFIDVYKKKWRNEK